MAIVIEFMAGAVCIISMIGYFLAACDEAAAHGNASFEDARSRSSLFKWLFLISFIACLIASTLTP